MKQWSRSLILSLIALAACADDPATHSPAAPAYPSFTDEKAITITGYAAGTDPAISTNHAMEPFIASDGNTLFFNSLNDSVNTSLYYATRTDDTTFELAGEVGGVNGSAPHLDAVPSMDDAGRFYFVSTRNYPTVFENLQCGNWSAGSVSDVAPVTGDFYIYAAGWLIMDAEFSRDGNTLIAVNAQFSGGAAPDQAGLCMAEKTAAGFTRRGDSDALLAKVNDAAYLVYAPSVNTAGTELYFTRADIDAGIMEICAAVRAGTDEAWSAPKVVVTGGVVEAPCVSADGSTLYYHRKNATDGLHRLYRMTRQ